MTRVSTARRSAVTILALVVTGLAFVPAAKADDPVRDPVVIAAGDIACDPADLNFNGGFGTGTKCRQKHTSDLVVGMALDAVLALGDLQYEDATYEKFTRSYDPSWGRVKAITRPVPGNHEYRQSGAPGYFQYFGSAAGDPRKGYYSFDLGKWHIVAVNSECDEVGGCGAGSPQEQWLRQDLAAHATSCTLAYWHAPRFSSGPHGDDAEAAAMDAVWRVLYEAGADVVVNGHDHDYERFAPQAPSGIADRERGIRQFVVGTGGKSLYGLGARTIAPNSEVFHDDTFGVLKLTLHATGYSWDFVPAAPGTFTDSGTASCSSAPTNTAPPSVSGTPRDGEILTANEGSWNANPSATFTYQWRRCDSMGLNCATIGGATGRTYALTPGDVGSTIRARVRASNVLGGSARSTDPTAVVTAAPPANTSPPTVSGTPVEGQTLTGGPGAWSGTPPIATSYTWRRCDAAGLNCITIPDATAETYTLVSSDVGATVRFRVRASNAGGAATRNSPPTAVVGGVAPANTVTPTISGGLEDGDTLAAQPGTWSGTTPLTFTFQWQRCDATGASCLAIDGETRETYELRPADAISTIRVAVVASNLAGSGTALSTPTGLVAVRVAVPSVETTPMPSSGDAADDAAIWVSPDPGRSTVIGTNKMGGGIAVYDLAGTQIQYRADGMTNNVDIRPGFVLGGTPVALVTASNRSTRGGTTPNGTIAIYRVDPSTRTLVNVAARIISPGIATYGSCMYRSAAGNYYYFVTSKLGELEQWELFDNGAGKVDAQRVRALTVGSRSEGCVADDELGHLYVGEEQVGIWKYSAQPDAGNERSLVDAVGPRAHLVGEVEGLTIVYASGGRGYLVASSQGDSSFAVYRREASNAYVRRFTIGAGATIDGAEQTDGIDATASSLGSPFPHGLFVAHDGANGTENQNYKLVPLEEIFPSLP